MPGLPSSRADTDLPHQAGSGLRPPHPRGAAGALRNARPDRRLLANLTHAASLGIRGPRERHRNSTRRQGAGERRWSSAPWLQRTTMTAGPSPIVAQAASAVATGRPVRMPSARHSRSASGSDAPRSQRPAAISPSARVTSMTVSPNEASSRATTPAGAPVLPHLLTHLGPVRRAGGDVGRIEQHLVSQPAEGTPCPMRLAERAPRSRSRW